MKARCCWPIVASALALACGEDASTSVSPDRGFFSGAAGAGPIPIDERPVVTAARPPPPISGGTLLVTRETQRAVAADPDRDRVFIVGLPEKALLHTVVLEPGDEPGRVIEDAAGRIHVALRRGGAVVTIAPETGEIVSRHPVCGAPRGMAYEADSGLLHVACASGELVSLDGTGAVVREVRLGVDIRDVVVQPDGLAVSRFKSAEMLSIGPDGEVRNRVKLQGIERLTDLVGEQPPPGFEGPTVREDSLSAAVAWRMLPDGSGGVRLLHQYGLDEPIDIDDSDDEPEATVSLEAESGAYGAPSGACGGIVQAGLSQVTQEGLVGMGGPILAPALSVDAAVSPDRKWLAIAHAGVQDFSAPGLVEETNPGRVTIWSADRQWVALGVPSECNRPEFSVSISGQTTAVAFNPRMDAEAQAEATWIAVQTREPAQLVLLSDAGGVNRSVIPLAVDSVLDTGHELFHRDAGSGIACASCHAEGAEDGRVWRFDPIGDRRTQAVHVGLEGTAPFHWDGDMADLDMLMQEVFTGRMGGAIQSEARVDALASWMFTLRPPPAIVDPASEAALRGRELFESPEVGCAECHAGSQLTSSGSYHVGTTDAVHALQVPSLVGIGYRAPFLHSGCAATLLDRFDPACGGGDAHGRTSQLSTAELGDLVAYLESL